MTSIAEFYKRWMQEEVETLYELQPDLLPKEASRSDITDINEHILGA